LLALEQTYLHNEKDLLLRVAEGDEFAFRVLYDHYRQRIYALGLFLTKSESQAQELVQDVFLKIWEKRGQLREIDHFNAWLRTIARNTAINYLRTRAMEKLGLARLPMQESSSCFTENATADREYSLLLQAAIRQLPLQQQKVYILHRQQGLRHEAIAQQLGISVLTSKKYMKLALRSIRMFLERRMDAVVSLAVVICFR
jgi:RNA polymerase sigma-70 factor (ECF subfamily)